MEQQTLTKEQLLGVMESYLNMIERGKEYPTVVLSDIETSIKSVLRKNKDVHSSEDITLTPEQERQIYEKVRKRNITEDVLRHMDDNELPVDEQIAEEIAEYFVNSGFDCNLSYWDNIKQMYETVTTTKFVEELLECLNEIKSNKIRSKWQNVHALPHSVFGFIYIIGRKPDFPKGEYSSIAKIAASGNVTYFDEEAKSDAYVREEIRKIKEAYCYE